MGKVAEPDAKPAAEEEKKDEGAEGEDCLGLVPANLRTFVLPRSETIAEVVFGHLWNCTNFYCRVFVLPRILRHYVPGCNSWRGDESGRCHRHELYLARCRDIDSRPGFLHGSCQSRRRRYGCLFIHRLKHLRHPCGLANPLDHQDWHRGRTRQWKRG